MAKVAFHTLGCKLNFSETSAIARQFRDAGWMKVGIHEVADVYVINTCSVTENADRECRQIVKKALQANAEAKVIIVGCYAQLKPEEIAEIPGVLLVLGASEKFNIIKYLDQLNVGDKGKVISCEITGQLDFIGTFSSDDRTRAFLKVQDGCDYNCSFCTIPLARGRSRSGTIEQILEQVNIIISGGVKEIVLTGVNLGDFGIRDASGKHQDHFIDLAIALEETEGLERIRISSIEPNLLTDEVIRFVASSKKFVPHFHIPLQSGSDEVLKLMRRRYQTRLYRDRIELIKKLMPDAGIGVDVIVGFPGETEALFQETVRFLHSLDVSYFHVFTYSERANTPAVELPGVIPVALRKQRNLMLRNISLKKQRAFYESQVGKTVSVLFEAERNEDLMFGYTENYIRVATSFERELVNCIVECEITAIHPDGYAEVIFQESKSLIKA